MNIYSTTGILNDMLISHEFQRRRQLEELQKLPPGELGMRPGRKKGQIYYYQKLNGKRKSLTGDMETARSLARKKYLAISLEDIDKNIAALKELTDQYI